MDWKNKLDPIINKIKHQLYTRKHDDLQKYKNLILVFFLILESRPSRKSGFKPAVFWRFG